MQRLSQNISLSEWDFTTSNWEIPTSISSVKLDNAIPTYYINACTHSLLAPLLFERSREIELAVGISQLPKSGKLLHRLP